MPALARALGVQLGMQLLHRHLQLPVELLSLRLADKRFVRSAWQRHLQLHQLLQLPLPHLGDTIGSIGTPRDGEILLAPQLLHHLQLSRETQAGAASRTVLQHVPRRRLRWRR